MASGLRCEPKATGSAAAPSRRKRARIPDSRALTSDSNVLPARKASHALGCDLIYDAKVKLPLRNGPLASSCSDGAL
jgi:hypothetical protein